MKLEVKKKKMVPFPNKKYQIIYANPPWYFENRMYSSNKNDRQREILRTYQVMKTEDICKLPIKSIADENCVLFIWTTDAHLPDCLKVISAWGFKYRTIAFIWQKKEKP